MPHHNSTDSCLLTQGSLDHGHTAYSIQLKDVKDESKLSVKMRCDASLGGHMTLMQKSQNPTVGTLHYLLPAI
jgi:hypothetical protein